MEINSTPAIAYNVLRKEIHKYYKKQFESASSTEKPAVLSHMQDALFGLEILSDRKIKKLVESSETLQNYPAVIDDLSRRGCSTRKHEKLRKKIQPFLIVASLLSAGAALYAIKTQHNSKPAIVSTVTALAILAYNNRQSNFLPPYPKTPNLTR